MVYLKGNGELRLHASVFLSGLKAEEVFKRIRLLLK
jgi:hypothetical protein